MTKLLLKTICFLLIALNASAQSKSEKNDKDYKERAVEVQQEIWNNADKAFGSIIL